MEQIAKIWYNRAWFYSDLIKSDKKFKVEFKYIRKEIGK